MRTALDHFSLSRRSLLPCVLSAGALALVAGTGVALPQTTEDEGWPAWAPTRRDLYARWESLRSKGSDIRRFGARLDGRTDDTAAVEKALAAGVRVLLIPTAPVGGGLRLTRQIQLDRPITILGFGDASLIRWEGDPTDAFVAQPQSSDPAEFVSDIHIDSIRMIRPVPLKPLGVVLRCTNGRRISITRCSTDRMGTLVVGHLRKNKKERRREIYDPAIEAGFSPSHFDDLNEDVFVYDNRVDAGSFMSHVVRFNYARRVAAVGNVARFAKISWFGGGAKVSRGGAPQFARRARDIYVAHNTLRGANGGIYGNNGEGIVVAHNIVTDMVDVGIDFEGCFNAVAHHNVVRNASNFGLATFYAAKNIVFRDNVVFQDGSAARLPALYGRRYGTSGGKALFAMRSAGFSDFPDALDVTFLNNRFTWGGKSGTGYCLPSYFGKLRVEGNVFENVECNMSYIKTHALVMVRNQLHFDRISEKPLRALGGDAEQCVITDNVIRSTVAFPEGAIAIVDRDRTRDHHTEIARNQISGGGRDGAALPIVCYPDGKPGDRYRIVDNVAGALYTQAPLQGQVSGNQTPGGRALQPQPLLSSLALFAPTAPDVTAKTRAEPAD